MKPITYQEFRTIVALRAQGCPWKDIAELVERPLHIVEELPWRYRATWQRDWAFATEMQRQETLRQSITTIETALHATHDPKVIATLTNSLARLVKLQEPPRPRKTPTPPHARSTPKTPSEQPSAERPPVERPTPAPTPSATTTPRRPSIGANFSAVLLLVMGLLASALTARAAGTTLVPPERALQAGSGLHGAVLPRAVRPMGAGTPSTLPRNPQCSTMVPMMGNASCGGATGSRKPMNWFDILSAETAQAIELRRIANSTARLAQTALGTQGDIQALINENRELRLYLTAITQLLVEKGILQPAEIQTRTLSLLPPLTTGTDAPNAGPTDENPFANLR